MTFCSVMKHLATTSVTGQGGDLVNTVDELSPSFVRGTSVSRFGLLLETNRVSEGLSNAIRVSAVEVNQVLVRLGDVDEDSSQELERVETCLLVDVVSGLGLVEDELGVRMVAKSGEVHGRAHQIAGKLVEPVGVGGVDSTSRSRSPTSFTRGDSKRRAARLRHQTRSARSAVTRWSCRSHGFGDSRNEPTTRRAPRNRLWSAIAVGVSEAPGLHDGACVASPADERGALNRSCHPERDVLTPVSTAFHHV